ncbi:MAG: ComEC/Rec2 family competence protein [Patescibacteria group bacterium]|nr:ComEC/Rec2 family competence protein [Patescibacteria group bacterium]
MGRLKVIILLGIIIALFLLRISFVYHNTSNYINGQSVVFFTTLLTEPRNFGNYQLITADLDNGQKIYVTTGISPEFDYGDTVRISGTIENKVLNNERTIITMKYPKIEAGKNDKSVPQKTLLSVAFFVRQKMISFFEKTLPTPYSGLLLGIVFGIKENMPQEFSNNLRSVGVTHVIAASGMNVTMVSGFLSSLFVIFLRRQIALLLTIFGIIFYASLSGFEPSIVRASIMGILAFSAQIFGRQTLALYSLVVAGFIMVFVSPIVLSDVGFQLSFAATLGLVYIKPLFEKRKQIRKIIQKSLIGEDLTTTISAQIATIPILFSVFGTYSIWSIAVNGILLWTIPILMIFGGIGGFLGIFFEPIGKLFLYLCLPFLIYFESAINFFAKLPGSMNINFEFPIIFILGYYLILISLVLFLRKNE